jgi:hypothetical protein
LRPSPRQYRKGTHFHICVRGRAYCQHHQHRRDHRAKVDHGKPLPVPLIRITPGASRGGARLVQRDGRGVSEPSPTQAGPMVRIRFAPAVSQVRTCLAGEFAFRGREATIPRWAGTAPARARSPAAPRHRRAAGIVPERGLFCLAVPKTRGRRVDGVANRAEMSKPREALEHWLLIITLPGAP